MVPSQPERPVAPSAACVFESVGLVTARPNPSTDQQTMDVNWSQTFETVLDTSWTELERSSIEFVASSIELDRSSTELLASSTELERSSTLPLTPEIDLATGFGVTNR